jgi:hypothetical protein
VKILIKLPAWQVPCTVTGLVLKVCPLVGDVIIAGLFGRGGGTTALTVTLPVHPVDPLGAEVCVELLHIVVCPAAGHVTLAKNTPAPSVTNTNTAYDASR